MGAKGVKNIQRSCMLVFHLPGLPQFPHSICNGKIIFGAPFQLTAAIWRSSWQPEQRQNTLNLPSHGSFPQTHFAQMRTNTMR
jgi:hypothetical protein